MIKVQVAAIFAALLLGAGGASGGWSIKVVRVGEMAEARARHVTAGLPGGKVLACGGLAVRMLPLPGVRVLDTAEIFDPASGRWSVVKGRMVEPRWDAQAVSLPDGRVLILGGKVTFRANSGTPTRTTEIFDPATGEFTAGPEMNLARSEFTATALADGRFVVAGGGSSEMYDTAANVFTSAVTLRAARSSHGAAAVGGERVLLAGGEGADAGAAVEVVDFGRGRSMMLAGRLNPPLNDFGMGYWEGRALLAAGQRSDTGDTVAGMQVIDLAGGEGGKALRRTLTATMNAPEGASDMAEVQFGPLVLLAGGESERAGVDTILGEAWLFDFRSERVIATAKLDAARDDAGFVPIVGPLGISGMILVGGLGPSADFGEVPQRSCEILLLVATDELPPMESIARSGLGRAGAGGTD